MEEVIYKYADGVEVLVLVEKEEHEELLSAANEKVFSESRVPVIEIKEKFKDLIKGKIDNVLLSFKDTFDKLNKKIDTSQAQLEFSISVKGEKNFVVSKLGVDGQFNIRLTWDYSDKTKK